jgi:hypothetical protein
MTQDLVLDARELATLHRACMLADNAASVQALVDEEGLMAPGSTGQRRMHPGLAEVRQTQASVGRLLALLKPADATAAAMRATHAARRRWG